jgi:hypothetical protein
MQIPSNLYTIASRQNTKVIISPVEIFKIGVKLNLRCNRVLIIKNFLLINFFLIKNNPFIYFKILLNIFLPSYVQVSYS